MKQIIKIQEASIKKGLYLNFWIVGSSPTMKKRENHDTVIPAKAGIQKVQELYLDLIN